MNQPKISIIVPVYKVEPYLRKCLDSIINQTYTDLEIILVDDGSPDNCGAICDEYARKDSRILVIHKENGGVSAARNTGLEAATGEYIGFVDSDDWIDSDMYENLLCLLLQHGADIAQSGIVFEKESTHWEMYTPNQPVFCECKTSSFPGETWILFSNSIWNKLYKASVAKSAKFSPTLTYGEDLLYNALLLQNASAIVFAPQAKYHYLQQANSISHRLSMQQRYNTVVDMLDKSIADSPVGEAIGFMLRAQCLIIADFAMQVARFCNDNKEFKANIKKYARGFERKSADVLYLTRGERLKMLLISRAWRLYRLLILLRYKFLR